MFSIESGPSPERQENKPKLRIESQYDDFLPENFRNNPQKYIEEHGENIKSGEIKYHEDGSVREDPTASKFLPKWQNAQGKIIQSISKKVNLEKVKTKIEAMGEKFEDPLLEFKMMSLCQILGLPSAEPIGFVEQNNDLYTLMERVKGFAWTKRDKEVLGELALTAEDQEPIQRQIEEQMIVLKEKFEEFGIYRKWKHKDMVFDLDVGNKKVTNIVPVDWERSHLDLEKLRQRISNFSPEERQKIEEIISLKT
ncbi:MAG: hypothetical protein WCX71_05375 [Candidatus Buchananbacteria bacterium]